MELWIFCNVCLSQWQHYQPLPASTFWIVSALWQKSIALPTFASLYFCIFWIFAKVISATIFPASTSCNILGFWQWSICRWCNGATDLCQPILKCLRNEFLKLTATGKGPERSRPLTLSRQRENSLPHAGKGYSLKSSFFVFFRNWGSMLLYMPFEVERRVCCHVDFFLFHVQYHSTPFRIRRLRASPLTHVMHACARVIYIYIEYAHIVNIHMYWNPLGICRFRFTMAPMENVSEPWCCHNNLWCQPETSPMYAIFGMGWPKSRPLPTLAKDGIYYKSCCDLENFLKTRML